MDREHVIEDYYMTDELDNGTDENSCNGRPIVIRFNGEETLRRGFTFKVGMEFSSLKQFKKSILEHDVLNGREVKFVKNDRNMYSFFCKDKKHCNYTVLCGIVLRTTTFKIKTLFQKHKYERNFFNKNANADWITRMIEEKLKNNTNS
ncbi:unnamed protein product [Lathyrus sativus]|nr:unnamed protein product [Lathyrus sativus]